MTYSESIKNIIDTRGQHNIPEGQYFEKHHIIPRCLGGKGDWKNAAFSHNSHHENCIWLYPKEHFLAHKLLAEENSDNYKLVYAWFMMFAKPSTTERDYEVLAEHYAEAKLLLHNCPQKINSGKKVSEETREKLRQARRGKQPFLGHHLSDSAKQKISAKHSGKVVSNETRSKMSKARLGKKLSIETRQKISSSLKGHISANKGKKMDENFSLKMKLCKANPIKCVETNEVFLSITEAANKTGIGRQYIRLALLDCSKTAGKYKWHWARVSLDEYLIRKEEYTNDKN